MSTTIRISQKMRQQIAEEAIEHAFSKEEKEIKKEENELAEKIYESQISKEARDSFGAFPKDFFDLSGIVLINHNGMRLFLQLAERKPYFNSPYSANPTTTNKLGEAAHSLKTKQENLKDRKENARLNVMSLLESVQTFKKLRTIWPQGERFYSRFDVENTKAGLPCVIVDDINKMLKL